MPDQTLDDQVRPIVAAMRAAMRRDEHAYPEAKFLADLSGYIKDLEALLPDPPRPTLADMTREERRACRRMQCDVEGRDGRWVIVAPYSGDGDAVVISDDGDMGWISTDLVTPRPDLRRMEWPGNEKPDPAPALPGDWRLADHPKHGRVLVVRTFGDKAIYATPHKMLGIDTRVALVGDLTFVDADRLTYIDQEGDTPTGPDTLAVGTVIESADDPRIAALPDGSVLLDRDRETVGKRKEVWMGDGYIPRPSERDEFGPWTVRRIGWEADQ